MTWLWFAAGFVVGAAAVILAMVGAALMVVSSRKPRDRR